MNIHEYQGKALFRQYGVNVPTGIPAFSAEEAVTAAQELGGTLWVVKAQIHAGGRGKGGGVKLAKNAADFELHANNILGMYLRTPQTAGGMEGSGKLVSKILVAEDAYAPDFDACKELYVSILMDREKKCNVN